MSWIGGRRGKSREEKGEVRGEQGREERRENEGRRKMEKWERREERRGERAALITVVVRVLDPPARRFWIQTNPNVCTVLD